MLRDRHHTEMPTSSSQVGAMNAIRRNGTSTVTQPICSALRSRSAAVKCLMSLPSRRLESPASRSSVSCSSIAKWLEGCSATTFRLVASQCASRAACCAVMPLWKNMPAGLPSSTAVSCSSRFIAGPSE